MNKIDEKDNDVMDRWYKYAAKQAGFVGQALVLVRSHTDESEEEQRLDLGADPSVFIHLQGMPRPRAQSLVVDANHIAEACGLTNPLAFVRAMILAHKIEISNSATISATIEETYYQAAFDERDDLDSYPEED